MILKKQANLQERRTTIQGLLTGKLSIQDLREPKIHTVYHCRKYEDDIETGDEYHVGLMGGLGLTPMEYEEWKKENVLPLDKILIWEEDKRYQRFVDIPGTNISCSPDMVEMLTKGYTQKQDDQPTKELAIIPKHFREIPEVKEIEAKKEEAEVKPVVRGGLMSEYGITWALKEEEYLEFEDV